MAFELWPFQRDIVRRVREELPSNPATCIVCPTGAGKTAISGEISLQIARQLGDREGGVALYLVHRRELLYQTAETLDEFGLSGSYGFIASDLPVTPWAPIQIISIPTLVRRLDRIDWLNPKVIFVDEAHHAAADTWARIINRFPNCFVIGLTATPQRKDGRGLKGIFNSLILGPQISDLQPEFLAPVDAFSVEPNFDIEKTTLADQASMQTGPVIAKVIENWERLAADRKTLFFAYDIDHSVNLTFRLQQLGYTAAHVDYKTDDAERRRIFREMRAGHIQCVSNSQIFTEGTDWPECECVVLARNTGSFPLFRQMNGRVMRLKKDGNRGMVIDTAGNCHLHGDPSADVEWDLQHGTTKKQRKAIAAATRECEGCGFFYERKMTSCPLCGWFPTAPQPIEVNHDVVKFNGKARPVKQSKSVLNAEIVATGGDMEKLKELRRKYGYHGGWPAKMADIFKHAWR